MQDTSAVIQAWVVNSLVFFQPTGYAFESLFLDTLHLLDPGVPQIYTNLFSSLFILMSLFHDFKCPTYGGDFKLHTQHFHLNVQTYMQPDGKLTIWYSSKTCFFSIWWPRSVLTLLFHTLYRQTGSLSLSLFSILTTFLPSCPSPSSHQPPTSLTHLSRSPLHTHRLSILSIVVRVIFKKGSQVMLLSCSESPTDCLSRI